MSRLDPMLNVANKYPYPELQDYESVGYAPSGNKVEDLDYPQRKYSMFGYDALTHNKPPSDSGYFKFDPAYPTANLPCKQKQIKEGFSNVFATLQALDVVFYYTDQCGYCQMTLDMLNKEGASKAIIHKNLNDPSNRAEFAKHKANGVPLFHSRKTNKSHIGKPASVLVLIDNLK